MLALVPQSEKIVGWIVDATGTLPLAGRMH